MMQKIVHLMIESGACFSGIYQRVYSLIFYVQNQKDHGILRYNFYLFIFIDQAAKTFYCSRPSFSFEFGGKKNFSNEKVQTLSRLHVRINIYLGLDCIVCDCGCIPKYENHRCGNDEFRIITLL